MKTITLVLALAAALALPAALPAAAAGDDVTVDKDGSGNGEQNKETCEFYGGTWTPDIGNSVSLCEYPDGSRTGCDSSGCVTVPARDTTLPDYRIPTPTTGGVVVAPQNPGPSLPDYRIPTTTGTVMTPTTTGVMVPATTGTVMTPAPPAAIIIQRQIQAPVYQVR